MYEFLTESNLNDNFWNWFGESKVVDSKGNPLVVYHGSHSKFSKFSNTSYFTDDYYNADGYAGGEYIYETYLKIRNPLIIDCKDRKWDDLETPHGNSTGEIACNIIKRGGFDGIIFINIKDSWIDDVDYQDAGTVYVVFSPTQIKSIDNEGTWNPNDPNIYK